MARHEDDDGDRRELERAFAGVKPLRANKRIVPVPKPRTVASPKTAGGSGRGLVVEREGNGIITGHRPNTHRSVLHTLEDPRLEIEAECDLHGLTARKAEREVLRFVRDCQQDGLRWVRIIAGKGLHSRDGKATLRDHVIASLSQRAASRFVLAFRTAPMRLGGTGAFVVRLVDRL